ncbi:aminoglycoside phosphotransferase [Nocardioides gansuensis]|uniref:Aminoglycoside phosphotransferase n=1 Tax=Nocardioides gansuensis TaxID=2138300 RepID=A0A2T8FAZ0_9ACTN|nr:phosphotransferase [Nocardioides gansuensis]PVG82845.1 aminoglycoside phosphotransferase [Nocardioides gansuensis]
MEEVEVIVAITGRATLRAGDVFLKIDTDQARTDIELEAMTMAPIRRKAAARRAAAAVARPEPRREGIAPRQRMRVDHHEQRPSHRPRHAQPLDRRGCRRPWTPVFMHGDLQIAHVFVDVDEVTGVVDWSEAGQGDALYDLASLTLGHPEHLGDVVAGYGADVDLDVIRGWWSLRSLTAVRWLLEHGFDPSSPGCEVDVLRSQL